jgi:predicted ester cyclase
VKQFFTGMRSVFSGMKINIEFMLADGNKVDCHFVFTAKHTGEFAGIKPKGNAIRLPAIATFRIQRGKLAEAWEIFDSGSLFQQMKA